MTRPLPPSAIKETITAICADPAHGQPLADNPQIAAKMQAVLRRMVNAAAGNEHLGERTLVALLGHPPTQDAEWQALKRWVNPSLGKNNQWQGDPALPIECQEILRCEVVEEIDLVTWRAVKDIAPIQVSYQGQIIIELLDDPMSNERGVFALVASDGEMTHNLRGETKLRVTAHPTRSGDTITVGEWVALDEASRPDALYGLLDERVVDIYPDALSPDLFTIKFEKHGAGSKTADTPLHLVNRGRPFCYQMTAVKLEGDWKEALVICRDFKRSVAHNCCE